VTLGAQDSFLITYRHSDGTDQIGILPFNHLKTIFMTLIAASHGLPPELMGFLYAVDAQGNLIRSISDIYLTLGPFNQSFFVGDGSHYLWMNLPTPLVHNLQSRIKDGAWTDKPRVVALGADENFLLVTRKNSAVWDLEHYRTLAQMLEYSRSQECGIEEVKSVVLHPYRYQGFVAQAGNGTLVFENLPSWSTQSLDVMRRDVVRDSVEEKARRRQISEANTAARATRRLRKAAELRKEWDKQREEFEVKAKAKGLKLSLSLRIVADGIGTEKMSG
jgi:hypothetical protein